MSRMPKLEWVAPGAMRSAPMPVTELTPARWRAIGEALAAGRIELFGLWAEEGVSAALRDPAAGQVEVPPRALHLRAIMAELERLANHLGDFGAIRNDAAFAMMLANVGAVGAWGARGGAQSLSVSPAPAPRRRECALAGT